MANLNPSLFLGNVQWKLAKQLKNSNFNSIFHNSTITANLLQILEIFLGIHLVYEKTVSPNFGMTNSNPSTF